MVRVNREDFLQRLEAVQGGLSKHREVIEQSSCFVFQNGSVMTYNDEVACRHESKLGTDFEGAVRAAPLIAILQKMTEEDVELEPNDSELVIVGKKRKAGIVLEKEILLSIGNVEDPTDWRTLPADFHEALDMVSHCAGRDESRFNLTCVHFTPKWIEACDNIQLTRYKLKTGFTENVLVRRDSIKVILAFGMTEVAETPAWMHFKNANGLIVSCRRFIEEYPDLDSIMEVTDGSPASLPKGLVEAVERAGIFARESTDDEKSVLVTLRPGKLRIRGQGISGWFTETKSMPTYNGPPLEALINPTLLSEITKRHNDCEISSSRLKVDGGRWVYVACLGKPNENGREESNGEASEEESAESGGTRSNRRTRKAAKSDD